MSQNRACFSLSFCFLLFAGVWAVPSALCQADSAATHYPDFATFGEHSFKVTHNQYVGRILPTQARPYETTMFVAIGENDARGYLAVTAQNIWENELIEGNVTLLLSNGSAITCNKKRMYSTSGQNGVQTAIALYFLSFAQLRQVAKYGVSSLAFPLMDARTNTLTPFVLDKTSVQFSGQ